MLPNSPFFSRLLRFAHEEVPRLAVRDVNTKAEKTYLELLTDVLAVRSALRRSLRDETIEELSKGDEIYIGVIAPGGYEFSVAMLAVLALGAAVVPMSTALPVGEALYFVEKSQQVALLCSQSSQSLGRELAAHIRASRGSQLPCITVAPHLQKVPFAATNIRISSDRFLDDNAAGVVIFTSGTTGPPKGSVMRRAYIHDSALALADHYHVTQTDVLQHVLPVHHATGVGAMFFPFLYAGACIEYRSGGFSPGWMWERWRQGGLTFFSGVPTMYMRMKRYFEQHLTKSPDRDEYVKGAKQIRAMLCGTSALPSPIQAFWTDIRDGKRVLTRYGATEYGGVFMVRLEPGETPPNSVGEVVSGIEVKLSEGDEGEVLTKSHSMFSRYLDDDAATAAAHDENGFFKTGDIARKEGKYYYILGRASLDIIKSGGYKISALDIEREILALPYIEEVMVVGVEDEEFGQRVAALISLRNDQDMQQLKIGQLRADLRERLAGYKMPTLLRVVEGELPKTSTGKVLKRVLGPKYFPPDWEQHSPPDWEKMEWVQAWYPQAKSKL